MQSQIIRHWAAWAPVAMSGAALAVVLGHIALYGTARQPDEGAAAHIWQLLMAGQAPFMLFFLARALRRSPAHAFTVIGIQLFAALAAIAPVWLLHL